MLIEVVKDTTLDARAAADDISQATIGRGEEAWRAGLMTKLADWFANRPEGPPFEDISAVVYKDRQFPGQVRSKVCGDQGDTETSLKVIYCGSRPDLWLVMSESGGVREYTTCSWYGMYNPSRHVLAANGVVREDCSTRAYKDACPTSEAYDHLDACEYRLERIDRASRIVQQPEYKNSPTQYLNRTKEGFWEALSTLQQLPESIVMAHLAGNSEVSAGTTWPFNHRDKEFFSSDGSFKREILEQVVPEIVATNDALQAGGFQPKIRILSRVEDGTARQGVPGIQVVIDVNTALPLLNYKISAPRIPRPQSL